MAITKNKLEGAKKISSLLHKTLASLLNPGRPFDMDAPEFHQCGKDKGDAYLIHGG